MDYHSFFAKAKDKENVDDDLMILELESPLSSSSDFEEPLKEFYLLFPTNALS